MTRGEGRAQPRSGAGIAAEGTEPALIVAARAGDESAFRKLTQLHVRALHLHCYRMLGSLHDAEDAVQETLVRAWRHLATFRGDSPVRAWLYRIATNACLTTRSRERRRAVSEGVQVPDWNAKDVDVVPLEPYPDVWLEEVAIERRDPASRFDLAESVRLAFLGAIQSLPPRQRAVLLLRDVLGWSAAEVAEALETTATAVNGLLQRARATLARLQSAGQFAVQRPALAGHAETAMLQRFVDAWNDADIERLAALLTEDALLTMPPEPMAYRGRAAIAEFFATVPAGGALDRIRLVSVRANRRPALAAYLWNDNAGVFEGYGLMVLDCTPSGIAAITGFADPALLPHFALPPTLEA